MNDRADPRPSHGWPRLLLATLLGPLALMPAIMLWSLGPAVATGGLGQSPGHALAAAIFSGFLLGGFGLVVALPITVAYLLPVTLLLQHFGRAHPLAIVTAGVVGGGAFGLPEGSYSIALSAYCGAAVTLGFWAIGRPALARTRGPGAS